MGNQRHWPEGLSEDDSNFEVAKRFYLEASSDSHGLVADGFAGRLSFSDFIDGCVRTFAQAAAAQVDFKEETPIDLKCRELDRMAKLHIRKLKGKFSAAPKRHRNRIDAALEEYSRRVNEIAARSKQRICKAELKKSESEQPEPPELRVQLPSGSKPAFNVDRSSTAPPEGIVTSLELVTPPASELTGLDPRPLTLPLPLVLPTRFNHLIIRQFASDRVADIRPPTMTYVFPPAFVGPPRSAVLAARVRAEDVLSQKKQAVRDYAEAETLLLELILQVFMVFAEQGHKLAMKAQLPVEDFEAGSLNFLRNYAQDAGLLTGPIPYFGMNPPITERIWRKIESSPEWQAYRSLLQEAADKQAEGGAAQKEPDRALPQGHPWPNEDGLPRRPSPKERVDAVRLRPTKRSYEKFAAVIGISKDSLYAITKEARWVSNDTYSLVARACNCEEEDLYPRGIPRPEHRRG
jgi:hypothetical protein